MRGSRASHGCGTWSRGIKSVQTIQIFAHWREPAAWVRVGDGLYLIDASGTCAPMALCRKLQGTEVLRFVGRHVLARGCGEASLTTQNDLQKLGVLLQPRPPALLPLDFQAGEVEARFKMDWCTQPRLRFNAKGGLQVRDATLSCKEHEPKLFNSSCNSTD